MDQRLIFNAFHYKTTHNLNNTYRIHKTCYFDHTNYSQQCVHFPIHRTPTSSRKVSSIFKAIAFLDHFYISRFVLTLCFIYFLSNNVTQLFNDLG